MPFVDQTDARKMKPLTCRAGCKDVVSRDTGMPTWSSAMLCSTALGLNRDAAIYQEVSRPIAQRKIPLERLCSDEASKGTARLAGCIVDILGLFIGVFIIAYGRTSNLT